VEVSPKDKHQFEKMMAGVDCSAIGKVISDKRLEVYGLKGERVLSAPLAELKDAWQKPLRW
jgi:phosphoribosylformylglycinamidine synthase